MPQCDLLGGHGPDCSGSYTVEAPHPGTALLGCIWLKAVAVLPHQSVLREESGSSPKPSEASTVLLLEQGQVQTLVGRY